MNKPNPKANQMNRLKQIVNIYNVLDVSHYGGDIDAVIERHGVWMLIDAKKVGKMPEPQQMRHYREMCDALNAAGKPCVYVVTWHNKLDPDEVVELSETQVVTYYCNDGLHSDNRKLKEFAEWWFISNGVRM